MSRMIIIPAYATHVLKVFVPLDQRPGNEQLKDTISDIGLTVKFRMPSLKSRCWYFNFARFDCFYH